MNQGNAALSRIRGSASRRQRPIPIHSSREPRPFSLEPVWELLESEGFEVVGEAVDGASAVVEANRLRPQLVLLDVQLPDIDGFDVAARITGHPDSPAVILVSSRDSSTKGRTIRVTPRRAQRSSSQKSVPTRSSTSRSVARTRGRSMK